MAINKNEAELEDEDTVAPVDKTVDVTDSAEDAEVDPELASEDGELDDTELDPFKDKWEE